MGRFFLGCGFAFVLCLSGCGESVEEDDDDDGGGSGGSGGSGTSGTSGTSGSGGSTSDGAVPLEELPTRLAAVTCKQLFACCPPEDLAENPFIGSTEAECRTNTGALLTLLIPPISSAVAGGRARYDADAMGDCLRLAEAADCTPTADETVCEQWLIPLVPAGGACSQDFECIGTTCLGESGDAGVTDGVCAAPLANGEDCLDDGECASGYCPLTCEPTLPDGSTCTSDEECTSGYCDLATYACAPPSNSVCD
jgi:hypothetical protein